GGGYPPGKTPYDYQPPPRYTEKNQWDHWFSLYNPERIGPCEAAGGEWLPLWDALGYPTWSSCAGDGVSIWVTIGGSALTAGGRLATLFPLTAKDGKVAMGVGEAIGVPALGVTIDRSFDCASYVCVKNGVILSGIHSNNPRDPSFSR